MVFVFNVPSPLLALGAVAILMATLLLWIWRSRRPKAASIMEFSLILDQGEITMEGKDFEYLAVLPSTFVCPACHKIDQLAFKIYRSRAWDQMVILSNHQCGASLSDDDLKTVEIPSIAGGKRV